MGMTSVSVVMTVMVLNFHHRGPFHKEVPYWLRYLILHKLRRMLCMKLPYQQVRPRNHMQNGYASGMEDSSFLRRISLKMTVEALQSELMDDMGLTQKMNGIDAGAVGQYQSMAENNYNRHVRRSNSCRPTRREPNAYTQLGSTNPCGPVFANESLVKRGCACYERSALQREVLKTLQMLISRQELDDECEGIANEWRQVAQVIDRLLFWVFLVATVGVTLVLLILLPLIYHNMETMELDEKLYGIR